MPPSETPIAVERLRRLNELVKEALALPAGEREGWLASRPAEDAGFLEALRDMLQRASTGTDDFMHRPVDRRVIESALPAADEAQGLVGPYRLVR